MKEWEIFLVLGEILAFLLLIGKPIIKLNTTLTDLIAAVNNLKESFRESETSNSKSHDRIWNSLEEHEEQLQDHEVRLSLMEKGKDYETKEKR